MRLIIFLLLMSTASFAQDKNQIPKNLWSKKYYISDQFAKSKGLKPTETNNLLRVWSTTEGKYGVTRLVDIRYYFKTPEEAEQHLKLNLPTLSETGDPFTELIKINQVSDLYVYTEGAGQRKMNEALGIKSYSFIFLFRVKNYLAKVFISTEKQMPAKEAAEFAREAAKQLNMATKNVK
jgi:hypothetical protein